MMSTSEVWSPLRNLICEKEKMKRKEEKENKFVIEDKMESRGRRRRRPTCDFVSERKTQSTDLGARRKRRGV